MQQMSLPPNLGSGFPDFAKYSSLCLKGGLRKSNSKGRYFLEDGLDSELIALAFLPHTVLEWMDDRYRSLHKKLPSRQHLFNDIRTLTTDLCLEGWAALTEFMLNRFDQPLPQPTKG